MDAITPDLPGDDVAPGVSSSVAPGQVAGDDPDSLFVAANLGPALAEIDDQLAAGQGIVTLHIEPGTVDAETGTGDGLIDPDDVAGPSPAANHRRDRRRAAREHDARRRLLHGSGRDREGAALVRPARHRPRHRTAALDLPGARSRARP